MKTKQTTLNDCNIGDQFTLQSSKSIYQINDIADFVDENNGDIVLMLEVVNVKTLKVSYMEFNKIVNKIIS